MCCSPMGSQRLGHSGWTATTLIKMREVAELGLKRCNSQGPAQSSDGSILRTSQKPYPVASLVTGLPLWTWLQIQQYVRLAPTLLDHNSEDSPISSGTQQENIFKNQSLKIGKVVCFSDKQTPMKDYMVCKELGKHHHQRIPINSSKQP